MAPEFFDRALAALRAELSRQAADGTEYFNGSGHLDGYFDLEAALRAAFAAIGPLPPAGIIACTLSLESYRRRAARFIKTRPKAEDLGVWYARPAIALLRVADEPSLGQYVYDQETGTYSFSSAEHRRTVVIYTRRAEATAVS